MTANNEIFIARLIGAPVFDPNAEQVGKVHDVVLVLSDQHASRAVGLVVEVLGARRRRIFVPLSRVKSISSSHNSGQVIITGLLNMRRFEQRERETLGKAQLLDRIVNLKNTDGQFVIDDFSITHDRSILVGRDWTLNRLFVRKISNHKSLGSLFKKGGDTKFVTIAQTDLLFSKSTVQDASKLLEEIEEMKPADAADVIMELEDERQAQVAAKMDNETLADVLEEMPEEEQLQILSNFETERVADVIEEMEPDDAADLLGKMTQEKADEILEEMSEEEADDVRQLLQYSSNTAGGLMTTTPVILPSDATVAAAIAQIRRAELSPALASVVFVCLSPLETPTGKFLGVVHFQQLLRYPPHMMVSTIIDKDAHALSPHANIDEVARAFATYDAFMLPVVDEENCLLGAISVDDLIDHMLPESWREEQREKSDDNLEGGE